MGLRLDAIEEDIHLLLSSERVLVLGTKRWTFWCSEGSSMISTPESPKRL